MYREPETADEAEDNGSALSLDRAVLAVGKRLKLVIALPIVAGLMVGILVTLMPDRFEASAVIQIDPRQKSIANVDPVLSDLKGDQPSIESEVEIVRSRPIVLDVIKTLRLRDDPEFATPPFMSRLGRLFGFAPAATAAADGGDAIAQHMTGSDPGDMLPIDIPGMSTPIRDEVVAAFLDRLKVSRVRNTLLIAIKFSASDAVKAARIANTVAEIYLQDQLKSKTGAASTATRLLESKLDEMRVRVTEAERKVEQWKALNGVFDSEGHVLSEKQLARLMEQTVNARNATSEARAKHEQATKLARQGNYGSALIEVLQSHTVRLLKEQLATATRKAAELATKYGPRHPEILKSHAEVAEAQAQVRDEIDRLVANLKNEADIAESKERELAQSLAQLKEQQIVSKDAGVELNDLVREAATSKQLFEALLSRYKQTAETQGFQLPDVRVVEKADVPLFAAAPKRKQLIFMASAGGLVLSIALALLLELMAPGIARSEDVQPALNVLHLSSVPDVSEREPGVLPVNTVRLIISEPSSAFADAIRQARRELDQRPRRPGPRIVLVTSSVPGEGAEMLASNLAHHFSVTGQRCLLIDGDLRLQTLTRQLAPQRDRGLLDQITSKQPFEHAVLRDSVTGLHFLPCAGPMPSHISAPEALGSAAMAHGLAALRNRFDTIVIAAPPLLPVIDARVLADHADQIVFVMTWQKTPRQLAKRALRSLGSNEQKVAGAILSHVDESALDEAAAFANLLGLGSDTAPYAGRGRARAAA